MGTAGGRCSFSHGRTTWPRYFHSLAKNTIFIKRMCVIDCFVNTAFLEADLGRNGRLDPNRTAPDGRMQNCTRQKVTELHLTDRTQGRDESSVAGAGSNTATFRTWFLHFVGWKCLRTRNYISRVRGESAHEVDGEGVRARNRRLRCLTVDWAGNPAAGK
jgi:hypothetical protein